MDGIQSPLITGNDFGNLTVMPLKNINRTGKKKSRGKKKKAWTEAFDNGIHAPQRLCHQDHFLVASGIHYFVH